MFNRLIRALVESYVGAIAVGYLLAQAVLSFVQIFSSPVENWAYERELHHFNSGTAAAVRPPFELALPRLINFILILLVWYSLLRWLYYKPVKGATQPPSPPAPDSNPQ